MDFFRAQHDARRRTRLLVGLFLLSLTCLLVMANLLLYFIFESTAEPVFYLGISAAILLVVLLSSVFKSHSLRQGGAAVAHMLNARLLAAPSTPAEQRLLNVVEEMAIASGTPVPPIYVMEESAINAFAAGHSINDAVIGITRGAINKLNRDELQGVIAHEFSHVLHGDMRLNLRLIAWLHGIMVLGIIGHYVIRAASGSRRNSNNNNNAGIALFGIGLIVLGASGNFFGGLIKAAVSRQREYLADASAVQYTRNPKGIADALKRIAADSTSPVLENPASSQISHALFSEGVHLRFSSLFATHPPLDKRIRVLDPQWNGEYQSAAAVETSRPSAASPIHSPPATDYAQQTALTPLAVAMAIARAGSPDDIDVSDAKLIHQGIPDACASAAHNPLGAAALICVLLMQDELVQPTSGPPAADPIQQLFSARLPADSNQHLLAEMYRVVPDVSRLDAQYRLPLVNICLGTLRQLSLAQYQLFRGMLTSIIETDNSPDLRSWVLFQVTLHHLDRALGLDMPTSAVTQKRLNQSARSLEVFLSLLSHCGSRNGSDARSAFNAAATESGVAGLDYSAPENLTLEQFQRATEQLANLREEDKKRLLNAVSICVYHDKKLTVIENELLKMTSEMLDWPLPATIFR